MKKKLLGIASLWLAIIPVMANPRIVYEEFSTGDALLDSLIIHFNKETNKQKQAGIGNLRFSTIVIGTSECTQNSRISRLIRDVLPFDYHKKEHQFEALIQGSYQHPCDLLMSPVALYGTHKQKTRKAIRGIKQAFMPLEDMILINDKGSNKTYVAPFSDDGLKQYNFWFNEDEMNDSSPWAVIHFSPKRKNHTLIEGDAWIDRNKLIISKINFTGLVDFGQIADTIYYDKDKGAPVIDKTNLRIDYQYGKTRGTNQFQCYYHFDQFKSLEQLRQEPPNYDLTDVYKELIPHFRDTPEATYEDEISAINHITKNDSTDDRRKRFIEAMELLPKRLVGRSTFNAFGSEFRVNGPLNPASIGYDTHNGLTLRERVRFIREWGEGKELRVNPELGYSFGYHQVRYRLDVNCRLVPAKRVSFTFSARNKASGFSSKFKQAVDKYLKELK
ncbi:MAG: DUF5686 family protein, partial [Bacteroidales bacterium]|nr:DUF5686 family protein [Bacteroidales bacterium]